MPWDGANMSGVLKPKHGRRLEDLHPGQVLIHPWELTLEPALLGLWLASVQEASPLYFSRPFAEALGFRACPVPPLLLQNLGLGFATHRLFEQSVAHLSTVAVRFPDPVYLGDTLVAASKILDAKPASVPDHGIITSRTWLETEDGRLACTFDQKTLVRAGSLRSRIVDFPWPTRDEPDVDQLPALPVAFANGIPALRRNRGFEGFFESFEVGDVLIHEIGKTVGDTEHMLLSQATRNSHPLHSDETLCKARSIAGTRVVAGGLLTAWTIGLTNRELGGNLLWELGLEHGAHPNDMIAGDTLYAATKVVSKESTLPNAGVLTLRIVGTKNRSCEDLFLSGLFQAESAKTEGRLHDKVAEVTRRILVLKRSALNQTE